MATFRSAGVIHHGRGSLQQLGPEARRLGGSRVLIFTDPGVRAAGLADRGRELLQKEGLHVDIFDQVQPEPPIENFELCLAAAREGGYDLFVGLGGGSSMDMCKAAAVLMTNAGDIRQYLGVNLVQKPGLPKIAIPTTAGTGSEVTHIAIVTDSARQLKIGVVSPYLIPDVAIVDPEMSLGCPPPVTAATGMDALTHAIEGYTSLLANPLSDACALQAMTLIARSLRTAVHQGQNVEARSDMALGALLAGLAFANASVTATHALAFALGGQFNVPHGVANAMMLPYVMEFNCLANPARFAQVARQLGECLEGLSLRQAALQVAAHTRTLAGDVGISLRLGDYGIPAAAIPSLAEGAISVTRIIGNNPRRITKEDIEDIFQQAVWGGE
jgi:alcohol dehydrogenase class IV